MSCTGSINLLLNTKKASFYGLFYINVSNISEELFEMHLQIHVDNNNWITLFSSII